MIIKEVFNDYKALYKMLNKRIDENEKEIKPETYFVREILKREDKNVKYIVSIIELIIPLLLFIIITIIAILMHKSDFIIKFFIGIMWLLFSIPLGIVVLMLNVRIINKKIKNKEKVKSVAERVILIEKFLGELIMICTHLSYLIIIK